MVAPFESAALKLKPNQMSDVVESEFGYHLIQLLEIRGQEYHARHILLRPDYQKMDLAEPTKYLDSIRVLVQRDSLKFEKAGNVPVTFQVLGMGAAGPAGGAHEMMDHSHHH